MGAEEELCEARWMFSFREDICIDLHLIYKDARIKIKPLLIDSKANRSLVRWVFRRGFKYQVSHDSFLWW